MTTKENTEVGKKKTFRLQPRITYPLDKRKHITNSQHSWRTSKSVPERNDEVEKSDSALRPQNQNTKHRSKKVLTQHQMQ